MSEPTKEYWKAKADLCTNLAAKQLQEQEIDEAIKSLEQASRAIARLFNINESEGE